MHLGWAVQVYNAAEALPNLINPFWMLPLLGILGLKARDVVGFTIMQFVVHVPMVLFLLWLLGLTLGISAAGDAVRCASWTRRLASCAYAMSALAHTLKHCTAATPALRSR